MLYGFQTRVVWLYQTSGGWGQRLLAGLGQEVPSYIGSLLPNLLANPTTVLKACAGGRTEVNPIPYQEPGASSDII